MQTVKDDWLNDMLANENWLVSSHESFASQVGLSGIDVSVRFIGNKSIGYKLLIIVLLDKAEQAIVSLRNNSKLTILSDDLVTATGYEVYSIVFGDDCAYAGFSVGDLTKYSHDSLFLFFESICPPSTQNVGDVKEKNRSINDKFQSWTRKNLSKFISINDFDSICLKKENNSLHVLELKRIQQDPQKWCPYLDDFSNYYACQKIAGNKFRTVVYNADCNEKVAVFRFFEISNNNALRGIRYVVLSSQGSPLTTKKLYQSGERKQEFESRNRRKPSYIEKCEFKEIR